jgi:ADP-ribose pyrophosphatase
LRHGEQEMSDSAKRPLESPEILLRASRFTVVRRRQVLADGTTRDRETVEHPGSVVILPVLEGGKICLLRNYRIAVGETLIELPAGTIESGDDPLDTAVRELTEETGYMAARWEKACEFLMSPGILHERMHLYIARELTGGKQALEPGEEIETFVVTLAEALALVDDGRIIDAKTILSLLWYERHRRR